MAYGSSAKSVILDWLKRHCNETGAENVAETRNAKWSSDQNIAFKTF